MSQLTMLSHTVHAERIMGNYMEKKNSTLNNGCRTSAVSLPITSLNGLIRKDWILFYYRGLPCVLRLIVSFEGNRIHNQSHR